MNALVYILLNLLGMHAGIFQNPIAEKHKGYHLPQSQVEYEVKTLKVDRRRINPRTVVVLEDTHFKPAK